MRKFVSRLSALFIAMVIVVTGAISATANHKYYPESGAEDVENAAEWELRRRQAQDSFERVAEMASFSLNDYAPGDYFTVEDGMMYTTIDDVVYEVGSTSYRNGGWTLLDNLDFQHDDGEIVETEDESTYTVQPNDGWWIISKMTGVPMSKLKELNNGTELHPGTILKVYDATEYNTDNDYSDVVVQDSAKDFYMSRADDVTANNYRAEKVYAEIQAENDAKVNSDSVQVQDDSGEGTVTEGYQASEGTVPDIKVKPASRTTSDDPRFPDSGALPVRDMDDAEAARRQDQDTSQRIAELAYFGIKFEAGMTFVVRDGIMVGPDGMAVGRTALLDDGSYTLTDDYTFELE